MKCDNPNCGYEGGVTVEKIAIPGKVRKCPTCGTGTCTEIVTTEKVEK